MILRSIPGRERANAQPRPPWSARHDPDASKGCRFRPPDCEPRARGTRVRWRDLQGGFTTCDVPSPAPVHSRRSQRAASWPRVRRLERWRLRRRGRDGRARCPGGSGRSIAFFDVNIDRSRTAGSRCSLSEPLPVVAEADRADPDERQQGRLRRHELQPGRRALARGRALDRGDGRHRRRRLGRRQRRSSSPSCRRPTTARPEAAITKGGDSVPGAAYDGYDTFTSKDGDHVRGRGRRRAADLEQPGRARPVDRCPHGQGRPAR